MKANELRIGNWINYDDLEYQISYIDHCMNTDKTVLGGKTIGRGFSTPDIKEVNPIPLTEEWLKRFGFDKFPKNYDEWNRVFEFNGYLITDNFVFSDSVSGLRKLEYVHQLQNLYHAMTGKELQIKKSDQ